MLSEQSSVRAVAAVGRLTAVVGLLALTSACIGGGSSSSSNGNGDDNTLKAAVGDDRSAEVGEAIELDGSASQGDISAWEWRVTNAALADQSNFEPAAADEPEVTFTADTAALYEVELTVTASDGSEDSATIAIQVEGEPADLTDAEDIAFFIEEDLGAAQSQFVLFAVDPGQPDLGVRAVGSPVTDNEAFRGDQFRSVNNLHQPDPNNLPLGVLEVTAEDGAEVSVAPHAVVYNSPDGHLYRVDVDGSGDNPEAVRLSAESEASAVCAAKVLHDHADVRESVIAYQIPQFDFDAPGEADCARAKWRLVRLGDSASTEPVEINALHRIDDFEAGFARDWIMADRDPTTGALTHLVAYQGDNSITSEGGSFMRFDLSDPSLDSDSGEALDSFFGESIRRFHKLGRIGDGLELVVQAQFREPGGPQIFNAVAFLDREQGQFRQVDAPLQVGNALRVENDFTRREQALEIDGDLYVFDIEDGDFDTGRLLRLWVDEDDPLVPAKSEVIAEDWGTGNLVQGATAGEGYLGWQYRNQDEDAAWRVATVDLSNETLSENKQLAEGRFVFRLNKGTPAITSPTAPVDNSMGSNFSAGAGYFGFEQPSGDRTARSFPLGGDLSETHIVGEAGSGQAQWIGQTWATTLGEAGPQAETVFYLQEQGDEDLFFGLPAGAPFDEGQRIEFNQAPVGDRGTVDGTFDVYGDRFLMGWQRFGFPPQVEVYAVDVEAETLQPVSTLGAIARPVPFQ